LLSKVHKYTQIYSTAKCRNKKKQERHKTQGNNKMQHTAAAYKKIQKMTWERICTLQLCG